MLTFTSSFDLFTILRSAQKVLVLRYQRKLEPKRCKARPGGELTNMCFFVESSDEGPKRAPRVYERNTGVSNGTKAPMVLMVPVSHPVGMDTTGA